MASVEVHAGEETVILPARNLSLGGIYVSHDGNDLSQFPDGSAVDILVFDVADETRPPVRGTAHVVRHDAHGMALRWDEDGATHDAVLGLLQSLKKSA
jgi:hypothetical protein